MIISILFNLLGFFLYSVDSKYIEYLHEVDNHVYFKKGEDKYNKNRPYIGLLKSFNGHLYLIPLSHYEEWRFGDCDRIDYKRFVILIHDCFFKGLFFKYIAAIRPCYMIPVKEGVFKRKHIIGNPLLGREYNVAKDLLKDIIEMAEMLYSEQMVLKKVRDGHVNFANLEEACDEYVI